MFSLPDSTNIYVLTGEYSISLVLISITIACCAAYTALSMNQRMQQSSFFHKSFWLFLSSLAMGLGIWSMHFIGMSAFMLPISMKYDVALTVISIIPAIFSSYLAFYVANLRNATQRSYLLAGLIMGVGISAMHYVGMAAMKMDAEFIYRPWLFTGSVIIAIVTSYIALYTFSTLQKYMKNVLVKIVTAIMMGLAISSMHYTGMFAVIFYVTKPLSSGMNGMHMMDTGLLITVVTVGISLLLLISGLTSLLDRYVDYRLNHFDPLTRLPNQRQFELDLFKLSSNGTIAIIHVHNLEKWTNSYGYTFGDKIILQIAGILKDGLPNDIKLYRIEGNRFALFQFGSNRLLKRSLEEVTQQLKQPITINHRTISIEMVCAYAESGERVLIHDLFSNALAVLQHPSIVYQHEVIAYDPLLHVYSLDNQVVQGIHKAMQEHELFLVYQPKIYSDSLKVSGLEALLRWKHPEYGMISPGVFIPILENSGEIFHLTDWIIKEVCKQAATWKKEGVPFRQISINIPGSYVTSPKLLKVIKENIESYDIDSKYLELEITETSVIDNIENAIKAANDFREMGLSVALDDFGTGLSSLSYLKRIPISTIKIDKSFVDGVPGSEKDASVLRAIITLCSSLNLKIVIEGVETKEQMEFILSMDEIPQIQGYFFSRPLEENEVVEWIWRGVSKRLNQGS